MLALSDNEVAMLKLLVMNPLSFVPARPHIVAQSLSRRGLAKFKDGRWFATQLGLSLARTLH